MPTELERKKRIVIDDILDRQLETAYQPRAGLRENVTTTLMRMSIASLHDLRMIVVASRASMSLSASRNAEKLHQQAAVQIEREES